LAASQRGQGGIRMEYKTELHCHSRDASGCSNESAERIAEKYIAAGYTTVCLTNHFDPSNGDDTHWEAKIDRMYHALELLKEAAGSKLNVLMGLEVRFVQNRNDYLVFGFDREYLLARPDILKMGIRDFTRMARGDEILTIQAHPFRVDMTVVEPDFIDGIEVYNGHPDHNSNNDIAEAWAVKYGKIMTSGTDHHDTDHLPRGGIVTDYPIKSVKELIETLTTGTYRLIKG